VLCPACITLAEDRADTQAFLDQATLGRLASEFDGREYPPDLAALAEADAERLRRAADDSSGGA
jgi:hypothetical protein